MLFQKPTALLLTALALLTAQTGLSNSAETYRTPPDPIPAILDTPPTPSVTFNPDRSVFAVLEREALPPIERLAEPELRLAGVRINPLTNGPSRGLYFLSVAFTDVATGDSRRVTLPEDALLGYPRWSPDGSRLAFTLTTPNGIELWYADTATGRVRRLTEPKLNAAFGIPFAWMPDGASLLVQRIPSNRGLPPERPAAPSGPAVLDTTHATGPVRTYQDLLQDAHDELLFEHYFTSQLAVVHVEEETIEPLGAPGIFRDAQVSPNGVYILLHQIKRPFTRQAPFFTFATETRIINREATTVHVLENRTEVALPPIGRDMVNTGPRAAHWRADAPASLVWTEAMDGGDARAEADVRDRVFLLAAPFNGEPRVLINLDQRYWNIDWGRDDLALVQTVWRTTSRTRTYRIQPGNPRSVPQLLWDRSFEDRYGDPGSFVTRTEESGQTVLAFDSSGRFLFLTGEGASPLGDYPFLDRLDLETGETERLWQAVDPYYEEVAGLADSDANLLITRRESREMPPNFFLVERDTGEERALTEFPDPAPQLAGLQREIITYTREDGILLSATLITPPGYSPETDGPLPTLLWAYPREFRDAAAAAQVQDSANRFSRPAYTSPLFLLTQGYAVLSGPAMPVIGEGDEEPNDTYLEQLVASAKAAVDKLLEMGVAEPDGIAIGGHSYGAFMAANLLAHSDLFQAGVARSGAYNRSLTPFGFQAEPRSLWEAQETYLKMSPFFSADRIRAPLLLIHGQEDNNSGTYPMQSERLYQAIAGTGGTARLVMLPHESHGYVARESVEHVLAETIEWLGRYLSGEDDRL